MHSKTKGTIGELTVATDLAKKGFQVFAELGDLSKVDLIVLMGNCPIKIQVKSIKEQKNGKVIFHTKKSGPNYSFKYKPDQVDVFAVYVPSRDLILYFSSKEVLKNNSCFTITLPDYEVPKTTSVSRLHFAEDYLDLRRALRDYTPSTLADCAEGDEIVQHSKPAKAA